MSSTLLSQYLKRRLETSRQQFLPTRRPLSALSVAATGGDMKGLSTRVKLHENGPIIIGGSDSANVILVDECVDGVCAEISTARTLFGPMAHISSKSERVSFDGRQVGPEGIWEKLPCEVDVAGVPMTLAAPPRPPTSVGTIVFCGLSVVFFVAAALVMTNQNTPTARLKPSAASAAPTLNAKTEFEVFGNQIVDARLEGRIFYSLRDNTIFVSGQLSEKRHKDWVALRRAWDSREGALALSSRIERLPGLSKLPAISAIRLLPDPYVVLTEGGKILRPGDQIESGWKIAGIGEEQMSLRRGSDTVEISYGVALGEEKDVQ